jgi:hypothetical protein
MLLRDFGHESFQVSELRETAMSGAADLKAIERGNAVRLIPKYQI